MGKSFADSLVTKIPITESISRKEVVMVQGVPHIKWTEDEVETMNRVENLQYVVVGKFTYEWADLDELRRIIPLQCDIKGGCQIRLFRNKHILIRMTEQADFINLISKGAFYILCKDGYSYLMRTLIYNPRFNIKEETTKTLAWISFPNLPPTYFAKEYPNAQINQQQHEESSKAWVTRAFGKKNESVKIEEPEHPAPSSHSHSQVEDKKNKVIDDQQEKQFNHELEINVINVQVMSESKEQDNQVNQEFTGSSSTTGEKREESSTGNTVTGTGNADLVGVEVE
ncbi:hypothetical protein KY289_030278 [Solanum tuberosum]|nr:hypothetical protein KY289_030278 [Solanum tuberosum]